MNRAGPSRRALVLSLLAVPVLFAVLFPMDLHPDRALVTFRADRFEPWGPPSPSSPSFNADCLRSYYPRRVFATEALREGRVPLWDPYSFCGQPFLANFQSGVFYPVNLALLPFSPARQMGIFVWVHLVLAGWGMILLLRTFRLSTGATLIGGLLYALCGLLAVRTGQSTMLAVPAWIPFLLWRTGRTVEGGSLVPLALVYACTILAGFPPMLIWGSLAALGWAVCRWAPERVASGAAPLARVIAGFLLGAGIAAVQLLPTAELLAHSDRIRFDYPTLLSSSWHPAVLIRLLVPDWFGTPFDGDSWLHLLKRGNAHYYQSFLSTANYIGAGALVFLLAGFRTAWRNGPVRYLLLAAAAATHLVLGTPLLRVVSALPMIGGARIDRIAFLVVLAMAVVAAFGFDRFRQGEKRQVFPVAGALLLALAAAALYFFRREIGSAFAGPQAVPFVETGLTAARVSRSLLFLAGAALLFLLPARARKAAPVLWIAGALLVADAGLVARRCHVTVADGELPRETEEIRALQELSKEGRIVRYRDQILPPNLPGLFRIEDVAGYNALNIKEYRERYRSFAPASVKERRINPLAGPAGLESPVLRSLSARWVLSGAPIEGENLELRRSGQFLVYENLLARPRVWFDSGGRRDGTTTALAKIVRRDPERVVVECYVPADGILVLTDTFFPGWKATVDGEEREIIRVEDIFRGVVLSPGAHHVEFLYEPFSFKLGVIVTLLSLAVAALVGLRSIRLQRRPETG